MEKTDNASISSVTGGNCEVDAETLPIIVQDRKICGEKDNIKNASEEKNLHLGHRKRMKERFLQEGLENFSNHEIIEMLLYYTIPQGNTNETAHELVDAFNGNLYELFNAPLDSLKEIKGIGEHSAILIKMIPQIFARYERDAQMRGGVSEREGIAQYLFNQLKTETIEKVVVACIDNRYKLIKAEVVSEGSVNSSLLNCRRIIEVCLKHNATSAIIAHNHPRGYNLPSKEDIRATERVRSALAAIDVGLLDHVIVSPDGFFSLQKSDKYSYIFR